MILLVRTVLYVEYVMFFFAAETSWPHKFFSVAIPLCTAVAENAVSADWFKDYIHPDLETTEPPVDIYFPLFDSVDSVKPDTNNSELVAVISSNVYVRDIIRNILPPGSAGVLLVVENECAPAFTYHVTSKAKYLGRGDFHDPKFDQLGVHARYDELIEDAARGTKCKRLSPWHSLSALFAHTSSY
jgi:hypothetical protein